MKKSLGLFLSLASFMLVQSCGRIHDDRDDRDDRYAANCVSNWVDSYDSILSTEALVDGLPDRPTDIFAVKAGNDFYARYYFVALLSFEAGEKMIVSSSSFGSATILDIPTGTVLKWNSYFRATFRSASPVLVGRTVRVSHVPCKFLFSKSDDDQIRSTLIGVMEGTQYDQFSIDLSNFVGQYEDFFDIPSESYFIASASDEIIEEIEGKIAEDIFSS